MTQELAYQVLVDTISMEMVLDHYRVAWLRGCGTKLYGRCPIHPEDAPDDHYFMANLTANLFECSDLTGDVLDFVEGMERCEIRDAAFWLAELFGMSAHARLENQRERL